jgi:hypothetical protein
VAGATTFGELNMMNTPLLRGRWWRQCYSCLVATASTAQQPSARRLTLRLFGDAVTARPSLLPAQTFSRPPYNKLKNNSNFGHSHSIISCPRKHLTQMQSLRTQNLHTVTYTVRKHAVEYANLTTSDSVARGLCAAGWQSGFKLDRFCNRRVPATC